MADTRKFKLFIGGMWIDGSSTRTILSPYSEAPVGIVEVADEALVDRAIAAGKAAEPAMAALTAWERREILRGIVDGLRARAGELASIISDEAGKPIRFARGEAARAVQTFTWAIEEAGRLADTSIDLDAAPTGAGRFGIVRRFPVGLVSAISPFNFPLNLVAHKVAPSIAAGCPVVVKPASQTPMSALVLASICEAAGVPAGGVNVVPCARTAADALTTDARPQLLTFTGSPGVGWEMKARAGRKKVVLELGGNAAAIVGPDTDVEAAVRRIAFGAYAYAGQVCISVQRAIVHRDVYDDFREALRIRVRDGVPCGDPSCEATVSGPLIDAKNAARVESWIAMAIESGASVLVGGPREGNVVHPTVLESVPRSALVYASEAFGPVMTLEPYGDIDEAIRIANDSRYGLQTGVFTNDIGALWRAFEGLEVGGVIHNDVPTFRVDHMPYGGVKDSGFGREGPAYALEDYTERRLLALRPSGIPG